MLCILLRFQQTKELRSDAVCRSNEDDIHEAFGLEYDHLLKLLTQPSAFQAVYQSLQLWLKV